MKIAFLLYPTAQIKIWEDTSFWIMHELRRRGHEVYHFESGDLLWLNGTPRAYLTPSRLNLQRGFLPSSRDKEPSDLSRFECIFIRKEPPFDNEYLWSLQLLETLKERVFMINDPKGIALSNEKLLTLAFPNDAPESCVTGDPESARKFILHLGGKAAVKPLHEKGGKGIFFVSPEDKNLRSLLEMATHSGSEKVMIQRYVPAERYGDRRILILDGKILGGFLRKPHPSDFRANLSLGGKLLKANVSAADQKLVARLSPELSRRGLYFVGIDVIGRYLTEINVTSPSGIADMNLLYKDHAERRVADFIEKRVF